MNDEKTVSFTDTVPSELSLQLRNWVNAGFKRSRQSNTPPRGRLPYHTRLRMKGVRVAVVISQNKP